MLNKRIGELIPIEQRRGQQAVNARYLYDFLGVKKDFSNWIKAQVIRCDLVENEDFEVFAQKGVNPQGGRPTMDYALSLNAAKEISMMSQTARGKQARRYFIECERIANEKTTAVLPKNYKQALTQLLAQVERNEQLQIENKMQKRELDRKQAGINVAHQIIQDQEKKLKANEVKVHIYDQVLNTPQSDDLFTTRQVAQEIGLSDHRLYAILMQIGILYKQSNTYMLYSEYINWGLHKMVSHTISEGKGRVRTYLKWSNRGRAYIHALHENNWNKRKAYNMLKATSINQ